MSTPTSTPASGTAGADASAEASTAQEFQPDTNHVVFKHFHVPIREGVKGIPRICKHCKLEFVGGAYRCAQHIVTWKGMRRREVRLCNAAPSTARNEIRALYEKKHSSRDFKRQAEEFALEAVSGRAKQARICDTYGDAAACAKTDADDAICLLWAGLRLPEHHADHVLWRNAVRCINNAPKGYVPPRRRYVGGAGLQKTRKRIEQGNSPIVASWKRDGVTLSSDIMTDKNGRPQANVLLINDYGAVFTESVDCKLEQKTGSYIASVLRPIVKKVGPEHVVSLCVDGGSNYASAFKELALEWPHIEFVPCATHVMDLLMEDVGRMDWAKNVVERANEIITYVRSHHFTRGYLRSPQVQGGKGKQVLKPAGTRFGTQFIAVSRLCEVRVSLVQMVLSEDWVEFAKTRKEGAASFKSNIMDDPWWKKAPYFSALLKLPFVVMRATDSTKKGMMGRIYDMMLQLTEDVNAKLEEADEVLTRADKTEITKIVGRRWDGSMACAMHVVGRILNPLNQEEGIFRSDLECTRIFKSYINRHYDGITITRKDGEERRAAHVLQEGLEAFMTLQGSFGLPEAISDRELVKAGKKTMVQWWTWHGTDNPELTALACRVLSQPVSAAACERNWAMWDAVHTARRNRLGSEKCRDLVFVAHNWNIVHNWHKAEEGMGTLPGNIPEPPIPEGYKEDREEEVEEGEDDVMQDEYVE
ncbi:unnamed protein product [Closterium sp. Yama58-4]|nr:unnamed protein product [Closterium sp. Yama58-4]